MIRWRLRLDSLCIPWWCCILHLSVVCVYVYIHQPAAPAECGIHISWQHQCVGKVNVLWSPLIPFGLHMNERFWFRTHHIHMVSVQYLCHVFTLCPLRMPHVMAIIIILCRHHTLGHCVFFFGRTDLSWTMRVFFMHTLNVACCTPVPVLQ